MSGYLFLAPWIIGGILLLAYPLIFSFRLSFSELENFTTYKMNWVGLAHYKQAFLGDIHFVTCITWGLRKILLETPIIVIFSLIVAIMISRNIKGKGFFRSIFFLPVLLGTGYAESTGNCRLLHGGDTGDSSFAHRAGLSPPGGVSILKHAAFVYSYGAVGLRGTDRAVFDRNPEDSAGAV